MFFLLDFANVRVFLKTPSKKEFIF